MTDEEKIVHWIIEQVNQNKTVRFMPDMGAGSMTVVCDDSHTHVGNPYVDDDKYTDKLLIKQLASTVCGEGGLSWA